MMQRALITRRWLVALMAVGAGVVFGLIMWWQVWEIHAASVAVLMGMSAFGAYRRGVDDAIDLWRMHDNVKAALEEAKARG